MKKNKPQNKNLGISVSEQKKRRNKLTIQDPKEYHDFYVICDQIMAFGGDPYIIASDRELTYEQTLEKLKKYRKKLVDNDLPFQYECLYDEIRIWGGNPKMIIDKGLTEKETIKEFKEYLKKLKGRIKWKIRRKKL